MQNGLIIPISIGPANTYLLKVNNRNTRKKGAICSKITIKTLERGTMPDIMHELCKVHKAMVHYYPPFRSILSVIKTPNYKLAKFLVPISKSLTSNEYTVKDSFAFAEKIIEQDPPFFMGSIGTHFLFTDFPIEETINICANTLFENT